MLVNRLLTPNVTPLISWNKSVLFSSSHLPWPELEAVCWAGREDPTRNLGSVPLLEAQLALAPALSFDLTKVTSNGKCSFHTKKAGIRWHLLSSSLPQKGKQMPSRQHLYSCPILYPILTRGYLSLHICISPAMAKPTEDGKSCWPSLWARVFADREPRLKVEGGEGSLGCAVRPWPEEDLQAVPSWNSLP